MPQRVGNATYGSSDSGGAARLSSGSSGPAPASRTSVASISVTTATPGTGSSITSTTTVSNRGGAWRLHRPHSLPGLLCPRLSLALAKRLLGVALATVRFAGLPRARAPAAFARRLKYQPPRPARDSPSRWYPPSAIHPWVFHRSSEATRHPSKSWTNIRAAASPGLASLAGSWRDNRHSMPGRQLCQRLASGRHIGATCSGSRTLIVGRCSHERRLIRSMGR
jgi:hypothetical protein